MGIAVQIIVMLTAEEHLAEQPCFHHRFSSIFIRSLSMTAISELPELMLRSADAAWDRTKWEQLPDDGNRYEIIDGVLYMTTAPSAFHQWILRQIIRILYAQIDDTNVGITFWSPMGVFMPGCDPVQPDLLVIRTSDLSIIHDRRVYGVPALLIEVLSPSNAEKDTEIKRKAYARAGVPEYWICLLYTSPSPRDRQKSRMPSSA